ncbi:MAG: putative peptidoglycan binding domain-containing protein, partial [Dermatophilaceae bacterium]
GDKRGRQSAALYAVAPGAGYDHCGVLADLRVDDHRDATRELARLLDLHDLYFGPRGTVLPLEGPLADEVRQHLMALGRSQTDLREALEDWAGEANFEMRMTPDGIDSRVLQALREAHA